MGVDGAKGPARSDAGGRAAGAPGRAERRARQAMAIRRGRQIEDRGGRSASSPIGDAPFGSVWQESQRDMHGARYRRCRGSTPVFGEVFAVVRAMTTIVFPDPALL